MLHFPLINGGEIMRLMLAVFALVALTFTTMGCNSDKAKYGPTVDAFNGKLTHDGKPVSFPAGEDVSLKVFHEKGTSFGIPIKEDGTFKIGWMPIGKYSGMLNRSTAQQKGAPRKHHVPGFAIEEGKTEYVIELGKDYKP
jgi:hypothetical protein